MRWLGSSECLAWCQVAACGSQHTWQTVLAIQNLLPELMDRPDCRGNRLCGLCWNKGWVSHFALLLVVCCKEGGGKKQPDGDLHDPNAEGTQPSGPYLLPVNPW